MRRRYLARLSGPLLDRVDVEVEFLPVTRGELLCDATFAESSAAVAGRVVAARQRAAVRLRGTRWRFNAEIPGGELRRGSLLRRARSCRWNELWTSGRSARAASTG